MKKLFWGLFLLLTFLVTLPASWWGLSKVDFLYSSLYDSIGISEHIAKYAPKNLNGRMDFDKTTKAERVELFHGIVEAINNHGDGLELLSYSSGTNNQLKPLLIQAEVIHLQDVANLLDKLKPLLLSLTLLWLAIVAYLTVKKFTQPSIKELLMSTFIIFVLCGAVLLIGPEKVFNQLHIWVFPDNHQWFFYYEESLMSTMMKAPDLFAYIAGIWGLMSVMASIPLVYLLKMKNI